MRGKLRRRQRDGRSFFGAGIISASIFGSLRRGQGGSCAILALEHVRDDAVLEKPEELVMVLLSVDILGVFMFDGRRAIGSWLSTSESR